jgi:hypothetical protein
VPSGIARALPERIAASNSTTSRHSWGELSRSARHWALPWYGQVIESRDRDVASQLLGKEGELPEPGASRSRVATVPG